MVAIITEDIYRSSNGDCWTLVRGTVTGRVVVRHQPNLASGGNMTDADVEDFLRIDGPGPEFAALRRLFEKSSGRLAPSRRATDDPMACTSSGGTVSVTDA
jgi:hypothetical protein